MKKPLYIFGGIVIIIVALLLVSRLGKGQASSRNANQHGATAQETDTLPGVLSEFSQEAYEQARAEEKKIALFFFSDWCPSCRNEISNAVRPAFAEIEREDVAAFLVNVDDRRTDDSEQALAREFQVLGRHVKVFLDNDGSLIQKSAPENWTQDQYVDIINNL